MASKKRPRYSVEVVVKPGTLDGVYVLFDKGEVIARWKILCGTERQRDMRRIGGRTPQIVWKMNAKYGKIRNQDHPTSKKSWFFGMIEPAFEEDKSEYENRTWKSSNWPFMQHAGSSRLKASTGSTVWPKRMKAASEYINRAFDVDGDRFYIDVFESFEAYTEEIEALGDSPWFEE